MIYILPFFSTVTCERERGVLFQVGTVCSKVALFILVVFSSAVGTVVADQIKATPPPPALSTCGEYSVFLGARNEGFYFDVKTPL